MMQSYVGNQADLLKEALGDAHKLKVFYKHNYFKAKAAMDVLNVNPGETRQAVQSRELVFTVFLSRS